MVPNRPWSTSLSRSRYGDVGTHGEWEIAIEHYHWERLEPAYQLAVELGVGTTAAYGSWFRLIEGETLTRRQSATTEAAPWLEVEVIESQVPHRDAVVAVIREACDSIADRLGWTHGPETLASVLTSEADAPWAIGRYGYMIDKYPVDKICLPQHATADPDDLAEVVAHEYAHVIVLNAAQGRAPIWLNEGVAMLAENELDARAVRAMASGEVEWKTPEALDEAHNAERRGGENSERVWLAYQQSALLGRFLASIEGERKIGDLLRAFADNSNWTELKMRVSGQSPADEALKQTFGLSERETFAQALEWVREQAQRR